MKVLIVNRFFGGAQIPTGRMAEDVARALVAAGHEVTALASSGEYAGAVAQALKASDDGVSVKQCLPSAAPHAVCLGAISGSKTRLSDTVKTEIPADRTTATPGPRPTLRVEQVRVPKWMPRAFAWLWFTWQARQRIPRMDWDVCVLMTDPPLLPLLARRAKRGSRLRDKETKRPKDERAKAAGVCQEAVSPSLGSVGQCFGRAVEDKRPNYRKTETPPNHATRRVAVWLMDLYPEALAASGRITKMNPLYKWYFNKRQRALGAADLLICLGETQKKLLDNRRQEPGDRGQGEGKDGVSVGRCLPSAAPHAVSQTRLSEAVETEKPNYRTTEPPRPPLTQRVRTVVVPPWDDRGNIALATEESLRNLALYAGNLGEAHCFEEILAAAPYLPGDWTIRFAARGAKLAALKAAASGTTGPLDHGTTRQEQEAASELKRPKDEKTKRLGAKVEITGYASEEETPGLLASARVHLITMSPGWEGIVVPSKLYGCIRTGRPVLFIGPENADTAREILAHDWGKVLPPGAGGEEVAAAILELAAWPTRATESLNGAAEVGQLIQALATD